MQGGRKSVRNLTGNRVSHTSNDQVLVNLMHKDVRRACTAAMNSLPTILALSVLMSAVNGLALLLYPTTASAKPSEHYGSSCPAWLR